MTSFEWCARAATRDNKKARLNVRDWLSTIRGFVVIDSVILEFDKGLRALFSVTRSARICPAMSHSQSGMTDVERKHAVALMRINHTGEVCAQALYQGQALVSRGPLIRVALEGAAGEESDHLAWTASRIRELGGRTSLLNPLWYLGSLFLGAVAGGFGDEWSLGFLAETERQVEAHLDSHLVELPAGDAKSRAIIEQMREDEIRHATMAGKLGGRNMPIVVACMMRLSSRVMTRTTYYI